MNELAPDGFVWRCGACGKRSAWKYGFTSDDKDRLPNGERVADSGWDESCMLNSYLEPKDGTR